MNARMLACILSAVMNSASRNDCNVAIFADKKIIVNRFFKSRLRYDYGNMNAFVYRIVFYDNINSRLVGLCYDIYVCGNISSV